MNQTIVAVFSENRKLTDRTTGVSATYRPVGAGRDGTCPKCAMFNNGCYAQKGFSNIQSENSKRFNADLEKVSAAKVKFLRLNVTGDFFTRGRLDKGYLKNIFEFAKKNPSITIWGYSHAIKSFIKAKVKVPKLKNLSIRASCDSPEDVKLAKRHGWRYSRVVDAWGKLAKGEARCRAQLDKTPCVKCGLCWDDSIKGIVFKKH